MKGQKGNYVSKIQTPTLKKIAMWKVNWDVQDYIITAQKSGERVEK